MNSTSALLISLCFAGTTGAPSPARSCARIDFTPAEMTFIYSHYGPPRDFLGADEKAQITAGEASLVRGRAGVIPCLKSIYEGHILDSGLANGVPKEDRHYWRNNAWAMDLIIRIDPAAARAILLKELARCPTGRRDILDLSNHLVDVGSTAALPKLLAYLDRAEGSAIGETLNAISRVNDPAVIPAIRAWLSKVRLPPHLGGLRQFAGQVILQLEGKADDLLALALSDTPANGDIVRLIANMGRWDLVERISRDGQEHMRDIAVRLLRYRPPSK